MMESCCRSVIRVIVTAWISLGACTLSAQTQPVPQLLPVVVTSGEADLPGHMAMHEFSSVITSRVLTPGTADLLSGSGSTGGWANQGTNGFSLLASGTAGRRSGQLPVPRAAALSKNMKSEDM